MKKRVIAILMILSMLTVPVLAVSDVVIDETILEPKDPILGTVLAIGPGLLAHGWGHFYAEDYRMGLMLFGLEVISVVAVSIGYVQQQSPEQFTEVGGNVDEVNRGGTVTMLAGLGLFAATWLADVAMAGRAAEQYNTEHSLEFKMQQESFMEYTPAIMYSYKF